jgi:Fur family peroxide stress response transcriptional regulator
MLYLLRSADSHPSADWVYQRLRGQYPDLSLGTVYRNLNQLSELGEIKSVGVVNGQERYDARTEPHAHFICTGCGAVIDLPDHCWSTDDYVRSVSAQYGFIVQSHEFAIRGLCKDCKKNQTLEETTS